MKIGTGIPGIRGPAICIDVSPVVDNDCGGFKQYIYSLNFTAFCT